MDHKSLKNQKLQFLIFLEDIAPFRSLCAAATQLKFACRRRQNSRPQPKACQSANIRQTSPRIHSGNSVLFLIF
jgi:hypothetical protein